VPISLSAGQHSFAAALTCTTPAMAQTAAPGPLFLFIYKPGPAWQAGKPMVQQKLAPHAAYIRGLAQDGRVVAGGPWVGAEGGMAIVRAANADAAKAILAADPAITGGVFVAEMRTWDPLIDSGQPLRP
jgi:uncharacterized protein YciI